MPPMFGQFSTGRDNNFNLIRLVAALLVLYSHSFPLTGHGTAEPLARFGLTWGQVAVCTFFFTSGYLVSSSLFRSDHIRNFIRARALRIFPALLVANLFSVFAIGLYYTTFPLTDYLKSGQLYVYLNHNCVLLFHSIIYKLPGVFAQNPYPDAVNGSLWTLPREVSLYLQLAIFGLIIRWQQHRIKLLHVRLALLLISLIWGGIWITELLRHDTSASNKAQLSALFFIGSAIYAWRDQIPFRHGWAAFMAGGLLFSTLVPGTTDIVLTLVLGYLVIYLAYISLHWLDAFNRLGDYSYGVYVYAFPVQQAIAATAKAPLSPLCMTTIAIPIVLTLAVASWHLVEKPMLALKAKPKALQPLKGH